MKHPVLRAIALVACFWAAYVGIFFVVGIQKGRLPVAWQDLFVGIIATMLLLGLTWPFVRHARGRWRAAGIGFERESIPRLLVGLLIGAFLYALIIVLVSRFAAPIELVPSLHAPTGMGTLLVVASFLALAATEELGFRGYPLRTLYREIGPLPSQLIVAVAFGLSHLLYGWTWTNILLGVIPSGLLFGAAAIASRGLALPLGVHAGLNLAAWSIGMKESTGFWTVTVPSGSEAAVSAVATWLAPALMLVAALGIGFWKTAPWARPADPTEVI